MNKAPLIFKSISIINFGGYFGESNAKFPLGDRNIMVVQGRNTGGKTSFLNALKWCLYGEVGNRAENQIPLTQLFNSNALLDGEDAMKVEVEAIIKEEPFTISRVAKRKYPNSKPTSNNDFAVQFIVKKDGQVLSEDASNRIINRIAPKIISQFFLFDGELLKEYEDLIEKRNRRSTYQLTEAIEDVLGLPALKTATRFLEKAENFADRNVSQKAQSKTQTKNLSVKLDTLTTQRDEAANALQKNELKLEELERKKSSLEKEVHKEREMDVLRGKINANKEQREKLARQIDETKEKLNTLTSLAWKDGLYLALENRHKTLEKEQDALSDQHESFIVQEHEFSALQEIISSRHCNACDQDVSGASFEKILSKFELMTQSREKRKAQHEALQEKTYQARKVRELLNQVKPVSDQYGTQYGLMLQQINELSRLSDEHDRMKAESQNEDLEAVRKRRLDLEQTVEEIGVLKSHISSLSSSISEHDRNIEQLIREIQSKEDSEEVEVATNIKKKIETLKKIFEVGRGQLREEMRKHVQDYASRAYKAMIHEGDHENVLISPENFELSIVNSRGRHVTEPSSGATQVLALALIVALGKAGREIGPIVMDSPFGRLDESHRERVLRYLTRQASQLVLLYHSGELQPSTLNTVQTRIGCKYTILKEAEGRSKLKEGEL